MPTTGAHGIIIPDPSTANATVNQVRDLAIQTEAGLADVEATVVAAIDLDSYATKTYVGTALVPYATRAYVEDALSGIGTSVSPEEVQDIVAGLIKAGPGIAVSYDDPNNRLTIINTGGGSSGAGGSVGVAIWDGDAYPPRPDVPLVIWRGPLDPRLIATTGFIVNVDLWARSNADAGNAANNPPVVSSLTVAPSGMTATAIWTTADADGDPVTSTITWGDGATTNNATSPATHTYTTTGKHTVTVTAFDGTDYAASSQEVTITQPPAGSNAPTVDLTVSTSGLVATATWTTADADGDPVTATSIDWGDGATSANPSNGITHAYTTAGTYTVTVVVSDGALSSSDSATITAGEVSVSLPVTDTFTRTGSDWGAADTGHVWVPAGPFASGTASLDGSQGTLAGGAWRFINVGTRNVDVSVDITAGTMSSNSGGGIYLGATPTPGEHGSYLRIYPFGSTLLRVDKRDGTTWTPEWQTVHAVHDGTGIGRLRAVLTTDNGTDFTLKVYWNGAQVGETWTGTQVVGLGTHVGLGSGTPAISFDNFSVVAAP